jgi:uncharacterized membrane protein YjjB (DUF3815 family)
MLLAFIGSLCAGILFNVKSKNLIWTGLSGALGWVSYILMNRATGGVIVATFIGAVAVGLFSESAARIVKSPATVFSIPGIFPLVPGIGAYTTVQYIFENRLSDAARTAVETIASAAAIAFGIMIVYAVFRILTRPGEKSKKRY